MTVQEYIDKLNTRYKSGITTEHSYRGDLQNLLETLVPEALVTNEPTRIKCGAPDYIITLKDIPTGYIEAKDLGADLGSKAYKEQFGRYRQALPNLIITNYLDFEVYKDGEQVSRYTIGEMEAGRIVAKPEQFAAFSNLIKDFSSYAGQTIRSPRKLAEMMAGKARMLADVINSAVVSDEKSNANSALEGQLQAFKDILIHDITPKGFADIYAQTIAYGMFAARLHDPTLDTFNRMEAAELIPRSNPFLRRLFGYIAGPDLDERLVWIVAALADIFRATDVKDLLKNFGKATRQHDPIIHFYETFLSEYDPKLRKSRGVWYTPEPVVNFIVRAVDDILKTEFGLSEGLADTSKVRVKRKVHSKATADQRSKIKETEIEEEVHRVQILDPATGTGTFLAEVIKQIHEGFKGQEGIWSSYVDEHLVPRLNGFELLMASYAMAHLKLDMLLTETGYKPKGDQRLRVYLTNSLEEHHPDTGTLFASWLSTEANEANHIKRDTPVMCVIGNPPYASSSSNNGAWIQELIAEYKQNLNERKININDDYIKFIRFGQELIQRNDSGIIGFITNNSFLDGITTRQMRKTLLRTFDTIYVLDLHGDLKKNVSIKDENVFDIQQGVSINLFIKHPGNTPSKSFHYADLYGERTDKYNFLNDNSVKSINWQQPTLNKHYTFFNVVGNSAIDEYEKGFTITDLFVNYNSGIQTKNDSLLVRLREIEIRNLINDIRNLNIETLKNKYKTSEGVWTWQNAQTDVKSNSVFITKILYRPFDDRYIAITNKSSGLLGRPRYDTTKHFINHQNIGLICNRQCVGDEFSYIGVTNSVTAHGTFYLGNRGQDYLIPLYVYPEGEIFDKEERQPNLDEQIVAEIAEGLGLIFTNEKEDTKGTFAPIDILDYIYAVLHNPTYRETYKEFLKIDFPRVPYPKDAGKFWQLVKLGGELRQVHLLESPVVNKFITKYPVAGTNVVEKIGKASYKDGDVYINDEQYFEDVPETAWAFYIGGYQPAQKWLKDRKGRALSIEDIKHYQKIIVALTETDRIMKEIDTIEIIEETTN